MSTLCKRIIDVTPTTCADGVKRSRCFMYPLNKCVSSRIPPAAFLSGVRTLSPTTLHSKFDRLFEVAEMADRIMHATLLNLDITSNEDKCADNIELYMLVATCMAVKFEIEESILFSEMIQSLGLRKKTKRKELVQIEANILQATDWLKGLTLAVSDS